MKIEASVSDVLRSVLDHATGRGRVHRAEKSTDSAVRVDGKEHPGKPVRKIATGEPRVAPADGAQVAVEGELLEAGFRSPATVNAIRRFTDLLLGNLEGEKREQVEAAIAKFVQRAGELSAADGRPYGLSIEHDIKQMLRDPDIRKAIRAAYESLGEDPVVADPGTPEEPQTVVPEPPADLSAEAPASRLDFST